MLLILFLFFRFTTIGLKMRGAAENPLSSRLLGVPVDQMLAIGWGIAAIIGAVSGITAAPILYLDPNMMGGVLLYSFAAALVGGINNPAGAVIGGFRGRNCRKSHVIRRRSRHQAHIGVGDRDRCVDLAAKRNFRNGAGEARLDAGRKNHTACIRGRDATTPSDQTRCRLWLRSTGVLVWHWLTGIAVCCVVPFWISPYSTFQLTLVLINGIALLGLNLLTGYGGQISIGHGAFYALGAYLSAILVTRYGVPYLATVPIAAVGMLLHRRAVRASGASTGWPLPGSRDFQPGHRRAFAA